MIPRGHCFGLVSLLVMEANHYQGDDGRTEATKTSVFGSTPTRTIDSIRCRTPGTEKSGF
jgi:hypothetical protein